MPVMDVLLLFLVLFLWFPSYLSYFPFPQTELSALQTLFDVSNGENWTWRSNIALYGNKWNFSDIEPNPCSQNWQGLICSSNCTMSSCSIKGILLYRFNMKYSLPDIFFNLPNLTHINISFNQLHGSLPHSLNALTQLKSLDISSNKFDGSLPFGSSQTWFHLEEFYGDVNIFNGSIPDTFSDLTQLKSFSVGNNRLVGTFPLSLCELQYLERLDLQRNLRMTGDIPSCIGDMISLRSLQLSYNFFYGSIPRSIGQLQNLSELLLDENSLKGSLPDTISNMRNLTILSIGTNGLNGTIPLNIYYLPNLTALRLPRNAFTGMLPTLIEPSSSLAKERSLIDCNLVDNHLNGTFPTSWISFYPNLRWLFLERNALEGNISHVRFDQWKQLRRLGLAANRFNGPFPTYLTDSQILNVAYLEYNLFTGILPSTIGNMKALARLSVGFNLFSGSIPPEIGDCTLLRDLNMGWSGLTGTIPESIGKLRLLNTLELYGNNLNGTIPFTIWNSSSISYLHLAHNLLYGSITAETERVFGFHEISLSYNYLSGNLNFLNPQNPVTGKGIIIPKNRLSSLNLQFNQFTGTLPELNSTYLYELQLQHNYLEGNFRIISLSALANLNIASNYFNGCIHWHQYPSTLALLNVSDNLFGCRLSNNTYTWKQIKAIDISHNFISGPVDSFFNYMPNLLYLYLANNQFSGNLNSLFLNDEGNMRTNILVLDLSNNHFTGTLPNHLFANSALRVFLASLNCLSGALPSALCSANNITSLVLDGMGASTFCTNPIFSFLGIKSNKPQPYLIDHNLLQNSQNVMNCLFFNAKKLVTLHLSGLGIHGSLPRDLTILPPRLRQVSLSNNYLTGVIPSVFFTHGKFSEFDLSFNQLAGTIEDFVITPIEDIVVTESVELIESLVPNLDVYFYSVYNKSFTNGINATYTSANITVKLEINRLSGYVPSSYSSIGTLNILNGNLFDCMVKPKEVRKGRYELIHLLPANDPNAASYVCGSQNVNSVLYVWISLLGGFMIGIIGYLYLFHKTSSILYVSQFCTTFISFFSSSTWKLNSARVLHSIYRFACFVAFATEHSKSTWIDNQFNSLLGVHDLHAFHEVNHDVKAIEVEEDSTDMEANDNDAKIEFHSFSKKFIHDRLISVYFGYLTIIHNWIQHYIKLIVFVFCIILPAYLIVKTLHFNDSLTESNFITYREQYLWWISACYMRGVVPTVVFGCLFLWLLYHYIRQMEHFFSINYLQKQVFSDLTKGNAKDKERIESTNPNLNHRRNKLFQTLINFGVWMSRCFTNRFSTVKLERSDTLPTSSNNEDVKHSTWIMKLGNVRVRLFLLVFGCLSVIIVINSLYVMALQNNLSSTEKAFVSLALSVFKSLSNHWFMVVFCSHTILYNLTGIISRDDNVSVMDDVVNNLMLRPHKKHTRLFITYLLIAVVCFSNVFAPYIAEALLSQSCFYYMTLSNTPPISSKVPIQTCTLYLKPGYLTSNFLLNNNDIDNDDDATNPLDTFVGDHVYYPYCISELKTISYNPPFTYSYTCSSSLLTNFANVFLLRYLWTGIVNPTLIVLSYYYYNKRIHSAQQLPLRQHWLHRLSEMILPYSWKLLLQMERLISLIETIFIISKVNGTSDDKNQQLLLEIFERYEELTQLRSKNHNHCGFDHRRVCVPMVTDWLLFLTLGVLFPPLAFCVVLSVLVHVGQNLLWLRRYMSMRKYWMKLANSVQDDRAILQFSLYSRNPSINGMARSSDSSTVSSNKFWPWVRTTLATNQEDIDVQVMDNPLHDSVTISSMNRSTHLGNFPSENLKNKPSFQPASRHTLFHICNRLNRFFTENAEQLIVEWEAVGHSLYTPIPYLAVVVSMFWAFTLFDTLGASVGTQSAVAIFVWFPVLTIVYIAFVFRKLYLANQLSQEPSFSPDNGDITQEDNVIPTTVEMSIVERPSIAATNSTILK